MPWKTTPATQARNLRPSGNASGRKMSSKPPWSGLDAGEVRRKLGVSMAQVYLAKFRVGAVFRKEVEYIRSREGQM